MKNILKNSVLLMGCFLTVMIVKVAVIGDGSNVSTDGCDGQDVDVPKIGKLVNCIKPDMTPGMQCVTEGTGVDCYMNDITCQ
jgi:hypothetical protein